MLLDELLKKKLINPPTWLASNCHFLTIHGSIAYGTNSDTSDFDVYGWAIPRKDVIFPHLAGEIPDFGKQKQRFDQWFQHSIVDPEAQSGGREYDITVYGIVRFFQLCMENNPNVLETLFTAADCVLHTTSIANMVRDNRRLFLHKGILPKLRGYAYSQLTKAGSQSRQGKRAEQVKELGWDAKFLSHVKRLALQAEDVLKTGDLDLRKNKEEVKAVKRGEVSLDDVRKWFTEKELYLQKLELESKLPWGPDEPKIKQLLIDCLEHHFGNLENCVANLNKDSQTLQSIVDLLKSKHYV